jgi:hypothetical protein
MTSLTAMSAENRFPAGLLASTDTRVGHGVADVGLAAVIVSFKRFSSSLCISRLLDAGIVVVGASHQTASGESALPHGG